MYPGPLILDASLLIFKDDDMKLTSNIGFLLLAIYLILVGISSFVTAFVIPSIVMGVLALVAGIFILIGR